MPKLQRYPNGMVRRGSPAAPKEFAEVALQKYVDAVDTVRTTMNEKTQKGRRRKGEPALLENRIQEAEQARKDFTAARDHAVREMYNVRDLDEEVLAYDADFALWRGLIARPHLPKG